ncbi:hypothetical protein KAI19_02950 [bacterium]|nr:hypothetical protein [bacterium]
MDSVIKILFFLIFFGVWIVKIAKKFSETKNTQGQASYRPQRREEIPQFVEEFPELDFEKKQEVEEPVYEADQDAVRGFLKELNLVKEEIIPPQPELVEDNIEEIPEEKVPEVALADDSWNSEEVVVSTPSIEVSDVRTGIVMSEILGKPIALR